MTKSKESNQIQMTKSKDTNEVQMTKIQNYRFTMDLVLSFEF